MLADKLIISFFTLFFTAAYGMQEHKEYAHEIQSTFAKRMFEEYDLRLSGSLHSMHENVEELGLKFLAYRRATIEEARALHLLVMEKYVQAINCHEKIQPFLAIHPFSFKRVMIVINFENINGRRHSDGTITRMLNISDLALTDYRNQIIYYSHDPFNDELVEQLVEPYEEALRLNAASSIDPRVHHGNKYEEEMDTLLGSFANEIQQQYELAVWHLGGKWTDGIENIRTTIKLGHFATQEEARQLLIEVTKKLLATVNSNEKVRPYLKAHPFPASLLKLSFHFENSSAHPLPDIRIRNATLDDNAITYIQETVLPPEEGETFRYKEKITLPLESYEEALKMVEKHPHELKNPSDSLLGLLKNWLVKLCYNLISCL